MNVHKEIGTLHEKNNVWPKRLLQYFQMLILGMQYRRMVSIDVSKKFNFKYGTIIIWFTYIRHILTWVLYAM